MRLPFPVTGLLFPASGLLFPGTGLPFAGVPLRRPAVRLPAGGFAILPGTGADLFEAGLQRTHQIGCLEVLVLAAGSSTMSSPLALRSIRSISASR